MPFSGPKWPICSEQNIFGTNYCYYFHLPISPFLCVKFKKLLTADPELWRCAIFRPKMVPLSQTIFFFWENYYYHSHLPISPLHFAKFKKASSSGSRVKRMYNFWAQNGPFPQMRNVTHNYIWAPNRKNYGANPKKMYGQTEGRMEGGNDRPYFIGSFRSRPGVQQPLFSKWLVGIHQILF